MGDPTLLKLLPPCASSPPQPVYSCPPTPPQRRQNLSARLWVDAWIRWPCVFPLKIKIESNNRKMPNTPPAPHKGRGRLRCLGIQAWQLAPKKPAPSLPVSIRIWLRLSLPKGLFPFSPLPSPGRTRRPSLNTLPQLRWQSCRGTSGLGHQGGQKHQSPGVIRKWRILYLL